MPSVLLKTPSEGSAFIVLYFSLLPYSYTHDHFTDEKTEAQTSRAAPWTSHSQ